jgi:hypothetical protein
LSWVADREVTVAVVPLKFTTDFELNPTPLIVTDVPAAPLVGLKPVIDSVTVKLLVLVPVPAAVVTEILLDPAPSGTTAFSSLVDTNDTVGDVLEPNLTFAPGTKFVPLIVTVLPVIADVGANDATVGGPYAYRLCFDVALVAPPVVTVTFTTPDASAGATAVNCVEETNVGGVAVVDPNLTVELEVKLVPLIVTVLPPVAGPEFGETEAITGRSGQLITTSGSAPDEAV